MSNERIAVIVNGPSGCEHIRYWTNAEYAPLVEDYAISAWKGCAVSVRTESELDDPGFAE